MFKKTSVYDLPYNVFEEIGNNWMLLSAKNTTGKTNAMTVSWGALGIIWGKEAATVYVRQSRYTKEFMDDQEYFTLSLFENNAKDPLKIMGAKSGRDGDKIAEAGLHVTMIENQPGFEESKCVLICKKMYVADMPMEQIPAEYREKFYGAGDPHCMYIGEIVGCYVKE